MRVSRAKSAWRAGRERKAVEASARRVVSFRWRAVSFSAHLAVSMAAGGRGS